MTRSFGDKTKIGLLDGGTGNVMERIKKKAIS